jgi:hypothetical protein
VATKKQPKPKRVRRPPFGIPPLGPSEEMRLYRIIAGGPKQTVLPRPNPTPEAPQDPKPPKE